MAVREILLLGNPKLYEISKEILKEEWTEIAGVVEDLHDTLMDFRGTYGAGRAIAAPQIGVMKRLIYMYIDEPVVFINPVLEDKSQNMIAVWDDCMCFPELLVKVKRHHSCVIRYYDAEFEEQTMELEGGLSELLQHEYDHLNGILSVSLAIEPQSFALKSQRSLVS